MSSFACRPVALPTHIVKRDGTRVPFDSRKIESAIARAGRASGEFGAREAILLAAQVVKVVGHRFDLGRAPDIEGIQDIALHWDPYADP